MCCSFLFLLFLFNLLADSTQRNMSTESCSMPSSFCCADGSVSSSSSRWCLNFHTLFNAAYSSLISVSILRNRFICSWILSLISSHSSCNQRTTPKIDGAIISSCLASGSTAVFGKACIFVLKNLHDCSYTKWRDFLGTWDEPHIWCSSFKLSNSTEPYTRKMW